MTDRHEDLRPNEAPLDALLRERVGHESPPELSHEIAARYARGDGAAAASRVAAAAPVHASRQDPHATTRSAPRPLLAAAAVLLGIGAVAGTIWSTQPSEPEPRPAQPAQQPEQDPKKPAKQDPKPIQPKPIKTVEVPLDQIGTARQDPGPESFRLRVVDEKGGPIQDFRVQLLTATRHGGAEQYGSVAALRDLPRHPRDFDGEFTTIEGLWPGRYAVAITDRMHARTISESFVIGSKRTDVVVRMNRGGRVRGVVVDAKGNPIAGAEVTSDAPAKHSVGGGLAEMFRALTPQLQTKKTVRTRADGSFDLDRLSYGNYELRARHIEFCADKRGKVQVTATGDVTVTFQLQPGTTVHGIVRKDGKPQPGVSVQIATQPSDGSSPRTWRVQTDAKGRYRLQERLPAGPYKATAIVETGDVENPFEVLLKLRRSEKPFQLRKGQREHQQDLVIE